MGGWEASLQQSGLGLSRTEHKLLLKWGGTGRQPWLGPAERREAAGIRPLGQCLSYREGSSRHLTLDKFLFLFGTSLLFHVQF